MNYKLFQGISLSMLGTRNMRLMVFFMDVGVVFLLFCVLVHIALLGKAIRRKAMGKSYGQTIVIALALLFLRIIMRLLFLLGL